MTPRRIATIQRVVADFFELSVDDLRSKVRTRELVEARQLAIVLSRMLTRASADEVARSFNVARAYVRYCQNKTADLIALSNKFYDDFSRVKSLCALALDKLQ